MKKAYQVNQEAENSGSVFRQENKEEVRINKYLTAAGFCSRRGADKLVEEKRVTVDGALAQMGTKVLPGQTVQVDGKEIAAGQNHVYIALNKPEGITCTTEGDVEGNIIDFMGVRERIFPIGRLDKDSSGLILLTSDGDIVNKILRAENHHEKEYIVKVKQEITPAFLQKMSEGVEITNMRNKTRVVTQKCRVKQLGPKTFCIVLTQGLNRQIRRMCTELGYNTLALRRVRIMNIRLGELQTGQWRYLTRQELEELSRNIH